jgi:hypothetical protein
VRESETAIEEEWKLKFTTRSLAEGHGAGKKNYRIAAGGALSVGSSPLPLTVYNTGKGPGVGGWECVVGREFENGRR